MYYDEIVMITLQLGRWRGETPASAADRARAADLPPDDAPRAPAQDTEQPCARPGKCAL